MMRRHPACDHKASSPHARRTCSRDHARLIDHKSRWHPPRTQAHLQLGHYRKAEQSLTRAIAASHGDEDAIKSCRQELERLKRTVAEHDAIVAAKDEKIKELEEELTSLRMRRDSMLQLKKGLMPSVSVESTLSLSELIVPVLLQAIDFGVFLFFAIECACTGIFVGRCVPETKGKTLEEIEAEFKKRK